MTENSATSMPAFEIVNVDEAIEIAAPREQVFKLLADPELIPTWWPIIRRFEPRRGGRFEMGARGWVIEGEVTAVRQPRTIAYTWRCAEHPPGGVPVRVVTKVRFELDEREQHTLVRLSHGTFEDAEQATVHAGMWRHYLGRLKDVAESTRQGAHE